MTGLRQVMQGEGVMILPTSAIFHLKESGLVSSLKITQPEMQRTVLAATNKSAKTLSGPRKRTETLVRNVRICRFIVHSATCIALCQYKMRLNLAYDENNATR